MEKINRYSHIVTTFLEAYAAIPSAVPSDIHYELMIDTQRKHYELLKMGFSKNHTFIHAPIFHFQIKEDGKVWILVNNTDLLIADELIENGVLKEDIVIGFQHPTVRKYTGYAVA